MLLIDRQEAICLQYKTSAVQPILNSKLGIALSTIGKLPINGLRHTEANGSCGWYIWCGEDFSDDADFFKPLHVEHISKYLPAIEPYLALPAGYRFQIANDYEDVWLDESLISI